MPFRSILFKFGEMVGFIDPNLHSKFHVQILSRFEDIDNLLLFISTYCGCGAKQTFEIGKFYLAIFKPTT